MSETAESPLTTDPAGATETCAYPGCQSAREPKADLTKTGPAPKYCEREDHNSVTAWRAKRSAKAVASGRALSEPEEPTPSRSPVTDALSSAAVLRGTIEQHLTGLLENVPKWLEDLQAAADPEAAEAQIEESTNNAARMVAEADERTAAEKKLRIAAVKRAEKAEADTEEATNTADEAVALLDLRTEAHQAELDRLQEQDEQREADHQTKLADLDAEKRRLTDEFEAKTAELQRAAEQQIATAKAEIEADAARRIADAGRATEDQRALAEQAGTEKDKAIKARDEAVALAEKVEREAAEKVTAAEGRIAANDEATEKALASMRTDLGEARKRVTELEKAQDTRNSEVERLLRERSGVEQQAGRAAIEVERLRMLLAQHDIAVPPAQA